MVTLLSIYTLIGLVTILFTVIPDCMNVVQEMKEDSLAGLSILSVVITIWPYILWGCAIQRIKPVTFIRENIL